MTPRIFVFTLATFALLLPAFTARQSVAAEPLAQTVALSIDYGDGVVKQFAQLPWKKGATVFDALQAAQTHSHGIKFAHRGSGETLFVSQIDDLTNEGGNGRNWRYFVNDKGGDRSCAIFELQAGDKVVWKFGK